MSITINFLPRKKTLKERVWKGLNVIVAVTTLLNVSGAAIWFHPPVAEAADSGFVSPTSNSIIDTVVTNPANAYTEDSTDAVFDSSSSAKYGTFGFSVPAGATIDGIEVRVRSHRASGSGNKNFNVAVSWNDGSNWSSTQSTTDTDGTYVVDTLGGSNDTWGHTWTVSETTNGQFAVRIYDSYSSGTAGVDVVQAKIYYTEATPPPTIAPNPALGQSCGLDIALVVDTSGSVDSTEMGQMKTALTNFASAFTGTPTVFSLSSFNTDSVQKRAFSRTPAQIAADITSDIPSSGNGFTNWDSGLNRGNATFDPRPAKANLLVIATDGSPNHWGYPSNTGTNDWDLGLQNAIPTANTIKASGTRIVVVGIGEDTSDPATPAQKLDKMKAISGPTVATTPGDITTATDVIKVTNFAGIGSALSAFASQLCGGKILVQKQFDTNGDGVADVTGNTPNALLSGYTFDVDGTPSNPAAQVTSNTGALEFSVLNGTYSVNETALPAGTHPISMQCVKGTQPIGSVNLQNRTITGLSLTTDETISCTVVNAYSTGSLKITKVVSGGTATPDQFGFRLVGSNGAYTYPSAGQNNVVLNNLQPGAYSVEETGPSGYHQTNTTCTNVQVTAGQQATCTVTNARDTGTLIVKKVLVNDNGGNAVVTDFSFKVNNGSSIAFEADAQNDMAVVSGTYSVVENPATGYATTYTNCTNVVIANGETATCTITNNDIAPTITLNKVVVNNNGGNAGINDFGLTVGGVAVTSGQVKSVNANTPIALNEAGLPGYTFVSITGNAKCPAVLNGTVSLNEGENITCTITNDDVAPTITLTKVVINNNGGNATPNDFGLTIGGSAVTSGQTLNVNANTPIALNEAGLSGYTFVSITGDAKCPQVLNGTITLNEGEHVSCTITNDDIAPSITLNKVVINNNGGTAGVNDFGLTIDGNAVTSGQTLNVNANTPIALNEAGLFGYSFVSLTGDKECPAVLGGTVTLNEGQHITCTITNDDIAPRLTVYKTVINNDGGTAVSGDFTLGVNAINATPSQFAGSENGTLVTLNQGNYEVTEEYFAGYSPAFSTDCVGSIKVGETKSCYVTNTDDTPHLMVVKHVINDNGGSNVAGDFTMLVTGTNVSDNSFPGEENGTTVSLNKGSYSVSESGPSGYAVSYSADCAGTIALGQTKICTVTNNDVAPQVTVIKHVINDNGGNKVAANFTMQVNGTNVSTPSFPGNEAGTTVTVNAGAYSVGEIGLSGYVGTFSADCSGSISVGEHKTCTVTNNDVAASITLSKYVFNNNGGTAGVNDFGLTIGATPVDSGDTLAVAANTPIALNEAGLFGYNFVSIGGDAKCPTILGGTVTLNEGEHISCTITNNDIAPQLTVIKHVVNDNGGNNVAGDFTMQVTGTNVSDNEFAGDEAGTTVTLNQGAYSVDEVAFAGYSKSLGQDCVGSIAVGEHKTCTITNNDIAPSITLNKVVVKDNGGTAGVNDFGLTIGATPVDSGDTLAVAANAPVALNEAGLYGYSFVSITGDKECPAVLGGTVSLSEGEHITCTITNDDIQPKLTVTKVVVNDNGGSNVVADFPLFVGQTSVTSGVQQGFNAAAYVVSETSNVNYASAISGDCSAQGNVTLAVGDVKSCTITNDDIAASIAVTKDGPATVQAGDSITYTLNWTVTGPGFAKNAMLVDTLPTNVAFDSASSNSAAATYDSNTGTVTWNLGTVTAPANGSETVTVKTADPSYNGTLVHNVVDFTTDDDKANDDHDTTILSDFDVTIDKIAPATVEAGAQMTYTLNWTVAGNAPIDSLIITDALPANTTFVSASNGGSENNGVVTWDLGAQNPDANGSVTLTVAVKNLLLDGTTISNTGEVCVESMPSLHEIDLRSTKHCTEDTTTTEVNSDFTVDIVKTDNIDPVVAGGQVIYTLAWSTSGNAPISNLVITDAVPANTTFVSASNGGTLSNGTVTWNLGAKTPGDFGSVTLTLQTAAPIANGTVVTNLGKVCGQMLTSTEQVVEHCDTDDETTTLTSTPSLSITKSNNVAGFTNPGKTVTYTVVVTNAANATDTARSVNLTDLLPTGFTFVDGGLGTKTFALGDIAPGASVTTTYVVNISAGQLAGTYTNTASAQGSNTGKVSATSNVEVRLPQILGASTSPDLTITKRANPTVTNPGKIVSYTVVVKNIGDADAENVIVTDTLPKGFTFVDGGKATHTWKLGTLKVNHERVLNYQVMVGESVKAGKYTNVATVTADGMNEEARATVEVKVPKVLGLATTGASARDYAFFLLGLSLIALGGFWMNRQRRSNESAA